MRMQIAPTKDNPYRGLLERLVHNPWEQNPKPTLPPPRKDPLPMTLSEVAETLLEGVRATNGKTVKDQCLESATTPAPPVIGRLLSETR